MSTGAPGFGYSGSEHRPDDYVGKVVAFAWLNGEDNKFYLKFEDGKQIAIWDCGQSCCEKRYMRTDDDPQDLVGGKLIGIVARPVANDENPYGDYCHEICFVEVSTDKGHVVFSNHNEHNGYYGGFVLTITEVP